MSNPKETAVEWLIKEFLNLDKLLDGRRKNGDATIFKLPPDRLFERAKKMEKEQIIDAYIEGYTSWDSEMTSLEYYTKTYKKK